MNAPIPRSTRRQTVCEDRATRLFCRKTSLMRLPAVRGRGEKTERAAAKSPSRDVSLSGTSRTKSRSVASKFSNWRSSLSACLPVAAARNPRASSATPFFQCLLDACARLRAVNRVCGGLNPIRLAKMALFGACKKTANKFSGQGRIHEVSVRRSLKSRIQRLVDPRRASASKRVEFQPRCQIFWLGDSLSRHSRNMTKLVETLRSSPTRVAARRVPLRLSWRICTDLRESGTLKSGRDLLIYFLREPKTAGRAPPNEFHCFQKVLFGNTEQSAGFRKGNGAWEQRPVWLSNSRFFAGRGGGRPFRRSRKPEDLVEAWNKERQKRQEMAPNV